MEKSVDSPKPLPVQPLPGAPLELTYAPPAKSRNRPAWVIAAGLFSTVLALTGVYFANRAGEHIMGLYGNYIIPAGAIIVGMAASSGYAWASWQLGVKVRRKLLLVILGLMFVSYFAAEYVEFGGARYVQTGSVVIAGTSTPTYRRIGFWEYFHRKAVNWTWKKKYSYEVAGEPLGMAGYFFVLLGIMGFCLSGLIIPAALGRKPYCELCERYMKTRNIALWPALLPTKRISKKDTEGLARQKSERDGVIEDISAKLQQAVACAQAGDSGKFLAAVAQDAAERKAASKALRRLELNLVGCPSCASGWLQPTWLAGKGNQVKRTTLPKTELTQEFIRAVQRGPTT
jgi:hypothetical protein